jgi:uncharacterized protein (UPF0548 family)
MFVLRRPSLGAIEAFLAAQRKQNFSYHDVGATRRQVPPGYTIDHNRACLGCGVEVFRRATELLNDWQMFGLGWVEVFPKNIRIEADATVAVLVHHFGFWSLNATRVIYVFEEARRYGFAYGTLQDHAEQGEERFSIEWSSDDSVWYDLFAFSRPRQWQARIAWPVSRLLQKRFASDSKSSMTAAIRKNAVFNVGDCSADP